MVEIVVRIVEVDGGYVTLEVRAPGALVASPALVAGDRVVLSLPDVLVLEPVKLPGR